MFSNSIKALTFDVFGTVVDWRSSLIHAGEQLQRAKGFNVDWAHVADAWRAGYAPAMNRVRTGELPWTSIDQLHRMILNELLREFKIDGLTGAEIDDLNQVWHRLAPWPDSVAGLTRLKEKYVIATLSNGNVALLVNMAKNAGLPWDCVLSADFARRFKPDVEVYLTAVELLGLQPEQVMMVAAHTADLRGARRAGLRTAFVARPLEYGPAGKPDLEPDPDTDVVAKDFADLANQLLA